jgi:acyl-CoA thioester hydrolase
MRLASGGCSLLNTCQAAEVSIHDMTQPTDLAQHPVVVSLPVFWGDQDAFGHVNNTVPIRWFESARIAYLETPEIARLLQQEQVGPILAAISCNYRRQITYPDTVLVGARVTRLGRSSLTMAHAVWSESQQAVVAEGESTIVVFDYGAQRPVRLSDVLRGAMERLEGRALEGGALEGG